MKGEIKKIHPYKYSADGEPYYRVEFTLENSSWAKTDLVPSFRNYKQWTPFLRVGVRLKGLELRRPKEINADCIPELFLPKRSGHWEERPNGTMAWVEDSKAEEMAKVEKIQLKQLNLFAK